MVMLHLQAPQSFHDSKISSTGQSGTDVLEHCASHWSTVSVSIFSNFARSSRFARTSARCAAAISRTSVHEACPRTARVSNVRIPSPYFGKNARTIILKSARDPIGSWNSERVDLRADYNKAFGEIVNSLAIVTP